VAKWLIALLLSVGNVHSVPGWILVRIAWVESRGNPHVHDSKKGAQGMMQLMPCIQRTYNVDDPWDPKQSATAAAKYLRGMHRRLGSWRRAVGGYGCGETRADRCENYVRLVFR
jgi:soluble lytic murein transglycosylase-like protein